MIKLKPTKEQEEIISAVKLHPLLKIDAVAGSGKSSTLKLVAEDNPNQQCLYLAYNKAMQMEAVEKMPENVECRTTHSIAYQKIGVDYQHKLKRPEGGYRNVAGTGAEIAKHFKIKPYFEDGVCKVSSIVFGQMVKDCVSKFEHSEESYIGATHVDKENVRLALKLKKNEVKYNKHKVKEIIDTVVAYAKKLWKERVDTNSRTLITHDTYLKLYQLSKPVLSCDILLLDEAQDANPCFISIVKNNIGKCKIVLVGDEHQAIYGWRGAKNAMKMFDWPSYSLSRSFRYGQKIAEIASFIVEEKEVLGCECVETKVEPVNTSLPYTILFRTNSQLVQTAIDLVAEGKKVNIQTDVWDLCKLISSAQALYEGDTKNVKHEQLFAFDDWNELKTECSYANDNNMARIVSYVEDKRAYKVLKYLNEHQNTESPDVVLTTAHKAKGLEYNQVVLADDFPSGYINGVWVGFPEGERNLLYVSVTRAKKCLQINSSIEEVLDRKCAGEELVLNVRIYSAKEYLNNPRLQLPQGEIAAGHLGDVIDMYDQEDYHEQTQHGDEVYDYQSREDFGNWIESIAGTDPNMMPCVDALKRESIIIGNLI